jgi:hypothetical protein
MTLSGRNKVWNFIADIVFLFSALMRGTPLRHLKQWWKSRKIGYLLNAPSPWITFSALDFISERLDKEMKVFEYGSGGSTLFWLKWDPVIISIEHDPVWFEAVRRRLKPENRIEYRLVEPEKSEVEPGVNDPSDPYQYSSESDLYRGYSFQKYVSQIDQYPDDYFDLVFIDGRARPSCILHSVKKIKKGGIIVLDNAERKYYTQKAGYLLKDFQHIEFAGCGPCYRWQWKTDIYKR